MIEAIIQHLVPKPYRLQLLMSCAKRIGEPMNKDSFIYKTQEIISPQRKCIKILSFSYSPCQVRIGLGMMLLQLMNTLVHWGYIHAPNFIVDTHVQNWCESITKHSPKQHHYRVMTVTLLKSSAPCSGFCGLEFCFIV